MLLRDDGLVIGQPAHAWVSGQLARAWGNGAFPAPAPREPVCLAAEQHDAGWQDADLAPLREQRALQEELAVGLDPAEVARNQKLIAALDRLSLALCHGQDATLEDVPGAGGPALIAVAPAGRPDSAAVARDDHAVAPGARTAAFTLTPWPFSAAALVVGCEARRLGADGAIGEWVPLRFALSPGQPGGDPRRRGAAGIG